MAFLLDTNILGRLANTADPRHPTARHAVGQLHQQSEILYITAQNLIEFRNFATRPAAVNGLGLPTAVAEQKAATFEKMFPLLAEIPDIYIAWKALVHATGVIGKQVHDARLIAVCHVHGITHLLTFDLAHITPLANFGPGVVVVDPATV